MTDETIPIPHPPDRIEINLNGVIVAFNDPIVNGRQVLHKSGYNPADDHVLVQIVRPGSLSRGLDEDIQIALPENREFRAFKFDRVLNFTVDGIGYAWGAVKIGIPDLYDISGVGHDKVFFLEREDEPDRILDEGDFLYLDARGVEHLHSGSRLITVYYNHDPFRLERRIYTTEELRTDFKVPAGYVLDLISASGEFRELKPGERVKVRDCMEFASHAPCGQSA